MNIGVDDVVKPDIKAKPFYVRVGICYTDTNGNHPAAGHFTITKGYKSYGGNGTNFNDAALQKYFAHLDNRFEKQVCINLDDANARNLDPDNQGTGCPANGIIPLPPSGTCPAGSQPGKDVNQFDSCIFPVQCTKDDPNCPCPSGVDCGRVANTSNNFHPVSNITDLTNSDGTPKDPNGFYYDATNGLLFF